MAVRSRKYEGCIDLNRSTRKYEDSLFSIAKVMYTVQSVKTPWELGVNVGLLLDNMAAAEAISLKIGGGVIKKCKFCIYISHILIYLASMYIRWFVNMMLLVLGCRKKWYISLKLFRLHIMHTRSFDEVRNLFCIRRKCIVHYEPKYIEVSLESFKLTLDGLCEMELDMFDASVRRFKQIDDEVYSVYKAGRWRHFFESDFLVSSFFFLCILIVLF